MRKRLLSAIVCFTTIALLVGCGNSAKEEQKKKADTFFKIADEINSGEYEKAFKDLESTYGNVDYSSEPDGDNKMIQYRLYYDKQQMYDKEMDVLLDYLQANDFKKILESKEDSVKKVDVNTAIHCADDILEKVSKAKKEKAIDIIGKENLDTSKEEKN